MSGGGRIISELANLSVVPFPFADDAPLASVAAGAVSTMVIEFEELAGAKW